MSDCCASDDCGCGERRFYTREERIAHLKTYQEDLESELQGVAERIADLEKER